MAVTVASLMRVEGLMRSRSAMLMMGTATEHGMDSHRSGDQECHKHLHTEIVAGVRELVNFNPWRGSVVTEIAVDLNGLLDFAVF